MTLTVEFTDHGYKTVLLAEFELSSKEKAESVLSNVLNELKQQSTTLTIFKSVYDLNIGGAKVERSK
jgi:hypothetical protein